jgi:hypothetical protein
MKPILGEAPIRDLFTTRDATATIHATVPEAYVRSAWCTR